MSNLQNQPDAVPSASLNNTTMNSSATNEIADTLTIEQKARFFDALIDYMPESITIKNNSGHYLMVNKIWLQQHSYIQPIHISGKTDYDFYSDALAKKFIQKDRHVLNYGEPQIGTIEKIVDNGEYDKRISMTRIPVIDRESGEAIAIIGLSRDISKRSVIEKELAYERDILHTLLDHSHDAIYFKDLECNYVRISRAHPAMKFLLTPEQAIGKSDFDYFSSEHAEQTLKDEKHIMETGEPIIGIIEHETGPCIPDRWVFTSKLPMYNNHGEIIGTFGVSRDITDIKKYENELYAAKNELEIRVKERTSDLESVNRHLEKRIKQLDFLTNASYEMAHCTELDSLSKVILKSFSSLLNRSFGALYIKNNTRFSCINTIGLTDIGIIYSFLERIIISLPIKEITSITTLTDWHDYFSPNALPAFLLQHSSIVTVPLSVDNHIIGLLIFFSDTTICDTIADEEKVLLTLAAHSTISISNALYYKELSEQAQFQAELEAARSIQQRLTPRYTPHIPRVLLKGFYSPAYEVGGDYLDFFENDIGCWVIVIADVCGKGIPAALLMTLLRSSFRVEAQHEYSARNLLSAVNNAMQINLDDRSFVTAICMIINPDGTQMSYARAGHPRLIRINRDHSIDVIQSDGIALGIVPDNDTFSRSIEEVIIPLMSHEHYFIYTDGLTEAFNPQKKTYGVERLFAALGLFNGTTPDMLIKTITSDIKEFTRGAPYHDDLTLIAFSVQ